jgi:hypothetical protein
MDYILANPELRFFFLGYLINLNLKYVYNEK